MGLILDGPQPLIPSANSGLPSGGTAGDALTGDEAWTPLDEIVIDGLKAALTGEVAGTALIADGAGDVATTSADVSALLAAANADEARTALGAAADVPATSLLAGAITVGGLSHQLLVTLTVTDLSATPRARAPIDVWLYYTQDINSLGLNSGTQVERILGDFGSGVAGSTRYYATTNGSGVVQISAGWTATAGTLYVEARVRGVPSAVYVDSAVIP